MSDAHDASTVRIAAVCLLAAAMLAVLPASVTGKLRDAVRAAVIPGQRLVGMVVDSVEGRWQSFVSEELVERDREIEQLRNRVSSAELQFRQASLAVYQANGQLDLIRRRGASPFDVETVARLLRPRAVRAKLVGRRILSDLKADGILDQGYSSGLSADQWVLDGELPVIEAGAEHRLTAGLSVFAGRTIVGRIVEAGRWTSSLQPITSADFRDRAVLAVWVSDGSDSRVLSFSSEGLLEGTGESGLCRMTQIPVSEQVEPGQGVYSPPDQAVNAPMLFGHVVSAIVSPGAIHWEITVRPATVLSDVDSVEVVVPELSPPSGHAAPKGDIAKVTSPLARGGEG